MTNFVSQTNTSPFVFGDNTDSLEDFSELYTLIRNECGIDLDESKNSLISARLQTRYRALKLNSYRSYLRYLHSTSDKTEMEELISCVTTNVTSFGRESHHFEFFESQVMPDLMSRAKRGECIRLWSAGCSNGSEPYTIACSVLETFPEVAKYDFKILATDIDKYCLQTGKTGEYPREQVEKLPSRIVDSWFIPTGNSLRVDPQLQKLVQFNSLNLLKPWPMNRKLDAVFCRNVIIYFSADGQADIFSNLAEHMKPGAHLFIGHSEKISGRSGPRFTNVDRTTYQFDVGKAARKN